MVKCVAITCFIFLIFSPWCEVQAEVSISPHVEEAGIPGEKIYVGKTISCDFQNTNIRYVIKYIAKASGKNIVIADNINGKITVKFNEVPWDQALEAVLSARSLAIEESGNVLEIYEIHTLNKIRNNRKVTVY